LEIPDRIVQVAPAAQTSVDRANAYLQMGFVRLHRGHFQAAHRVCALAVADLERAIAAAGPAWLPQWGKANYALAVVLREAGHERQARECANDILGRRTALATPEWRQVIGMAKQFFQEPPAG
jgi:hypothetical protein